MKHEWVTVKDKDGVEYSINMGFVVYLKEKGGITTIVLSVPNANGGKTITFPTANVAHLWRRRKEKKQAKQGIPLVKQSGTVQQIG